MRTTALVLALLFAGALLGCSRKPDINIVDAEVKEEWRTCTFVKVSNLKKQLLEDGKSYRIVYSYDLEVLTDPIELVAGQAACPHDKAVLLEATAHEDIGKFKKGQIIDVNMEKVFPK